MIVTIKVTVIVLFIMFGMSYINTANWHPFIPPNEGHFGTYGWSGVLAAAGVIFFAYIGFDAISTAAQESQEPAARHADRHPGEPGRSARSCT